MDSDECARFDNALTQWIETGWEESDRVVPAELKQHADHCERCRRALNLALRLAGIPHRAPAGLADGVISRIAEEQRPRAHRRVPALAAAALLMVALGIGIFLGTARGQTVTVELTLHAPQASSVAVVGGWNNWDPSRDPMHDPDGDGLWQIELELRSGSEYLYQFVIDNETRAADPLALINIEDGYGSVNSVMNL